LEHPVTIGQIREFFVQNLLNKFLPSGLTVGSGKIISSFKEKMSNQIDIIVFDNRFPKFSMTGNPFNSLYPVEGVVATIEVKTKLNKNTLKEGLNNCYSVYNLPFITDWGDCNTSLNKLMKAQKLSKKEAGRALSWKLGPRTYIFAFEGYKDNDKALLETVYDWINENKIEVKHHCTMLPRIIVGEGIVGVSNDDIISVRNKFMVFKTKIRFGILASHLLSVIADRFKPRYERYNVCFSTKGYNIINLYLDELIKKNTMGITRLD